jgi:hypothetical protein
MSAHLTPNYRKRIELVQATQLTQELIEAAVFDKGPLPAGVEIVGSYSNPGKRTLYRADIRVGKEFVDIGDWVTTDTDGHTAYWAPDIFECIFEPLAKTLESATALAATIQQATEPRITRIDFAPGHEDARLTNEQAAAPPIGAYVLATKYHDGDPGDRWAVGFYAGMERDRHMVKNSDGKQIHVGGYRGVIRIPFAVGKWLLDNARMLESSPPGAINLLQMVATPFNAERITEEVVAAEGRSPQEPA